jgi:hypothetical protein
VPFDPFTPAIWISSMQKQSKACFRQKQVLRTLKAGLHKSVRIKVIPVAGTMLKGGISQPPQISDKKDFKLNTL